MDNAEFSSTNQIAPRNQPDNIFSSWVFTLAKMNIDSTNINIQQAIRYIDLHNEEIRQKNEEIERTNG